MALLVLVLPTLLIRQLTNDDIYPAEESPHSEAIVVLGASVYNDRPSPVVARRLDTAVDLVNRGKSAKIILLGYSDGGKYNEPRVMRNYLTGKLPAGKDIEIIEDTHGAGTYESCLRLKNEYKFDTYTIITQKFHIHRAIFTCQQLGLRVQGVVAINVLQTNRVTYASREVFASWKAILDLFVLH